MSEELYFNNELRKCLNAAGLSDCGENDAWNYWYQRLHKAHDAAVDRVTETQRAENAKLRELMYERAHVYAIQNMTEDELRITATNVMEDNAKLRELVMDMYDFFCVVPDEPHVFKEELDFSVDVWRRMRELGIEANE